MWEKVKDNRFGVWIGEAGQGAGEFTVVSIWIG
jgi:hypothetical protein